jgi:hypothetical protein|tara:strand:- start:561 stop:731 length:171 start_codon:yes stop_codon:yes gene_type:complete
MKIFNKIEVPLYLLTIGICMLENEKTTLGITLIIISFIRLWLNSLNDDSLNNGERN